MKKILYIVSNPFSYSRSPVGGNISSASGVIMGFVQQGYYVDIVTDSLIPSIDTENDKIKIIYYPLRTLRMMTPIYFKGFIGKVFKKIDNWLFQISMKKKVNLLVKNTDYDFCYMRSSYNGGAITNILQDRNLNLVLEVNKPLSMGPFNNKDTLDWPKNNGLVKVPVAEIKQYDAATLITVDSTLRANWITEFVDSSYYEKMIINYNGVNTKMFKPSLSKNDILDESMLADDDILVGMASSFRWYNDIDELCRIYSKALAQIDNLKFLFIVGNKEKELELQIKTNEYSLNDSTIILYQVPFSQMPPTLNYCDILVSHFNFHGKWPHNCSIKHLEYLSMGKATIATNVGEVNFAITDGVDGFLCEQGNIDDFADKIVELAQNPELRKKLGKAARQKAERELDWSLNVQNILNHLNQNSSSSVTHKIL